METPDFLKKKYNLHNAPEVTAAAKRTEIRIGEKVSQKPLDRIQNYLDRFKEIIDHEDEGKRENGIEALKYLLHKNFVIKAETIPEETFLLEQRIAREQGHGDVEITDEFKEQKTGQIINNQTQSLDKWVDYLASDDAEYPDWAKYWAFRSMVEMGKLVKEEKDGKETVRFQKRTTDTVASFPPLNPRVIALTIGMLRSRLEENDKPKNERQPIENKSIKLSDKEFQDLLSTENFSKIYSQFLVEMPEYTAEGLQDTRGEWMKYSQGSDAGPLVQSLEGHPLEWCTADFDTARKQLQGGDFYVYYSMDQNDKPIIPRAAIRMEKNKIAEVRGIAANQNLDPYISEVVKEKMTEFPDGKLYEKKSADMKLLTEIEKKTTSNQQLNKDELLFLYEINAPIGGFGYEKDPRIDEICQGRNADEDMQVMFECTKDEIAHLSSQINENTKAYVGPLEPGIFQRLPESLEYVYTSFPDKKIRREHIKIGGKTGKQLIQQLEQVGMNISDPTKDALLNPEVIASKNPEEVTVVRLTVAELGFATKATTDQIYTRAQELGLELCPVEVGPQYRLAYQNQPMNEQVNIGMKQISDSGGNQFVFRVERNVAGLWLNDRWMGPNDDSYLDNEFVFCLRTSGDHTD